MGLMPDSVAQRILRRSVGRSLRGSLASVSIAGQRPRSATVLAANHASWWDGYLLGALAGSVGRTSSTMMTSRQLARFPFLRLVGAVDTGGARELVRRARRGQWVVVFPEGRMRSGPGLGPLHPGAEWVARGAGVPLVPVALRVVVRGAPQPEALVRFGEPLTAPHPPQRLEDALAALVTRLDADIAASDPEQPVPGYRVVLRGSAARRDDDGPAVRALARLTGEA